MNKYYILSFLFILSGCGPFSYRQSLTSERISKSNEIANIKINKYKKDIRKIKDYKHYEYYTDIKDPFRARPFILREVEKKKDTYLKKVVCKEAFCRPPEAHKKTFLEGFSISQLAFVGTLRKKGMINVALIRTPNSDIVELKKGGYMGTNYGKVIKIDDTSIVLQEKFFNSSGIWEDKKTVININK